MLHFFIADSHVANHRALGGPFVDGLNTRALACDRAFHRLGRVLATTRSSVDADPTTIGTPFKVHIVGDVFDNDTPSPALMGMFARRLRGLSQEAKGAMFVLTVGNHDATTMTAHALLVVAEMTNIVVDVVDRAAVEANEVLSIPFRPEPAATYIPRLCSEYKERRWTDVITFHAGVRDGTEPVWLSDAVDAIHVDDVFKLAAKYHTRLVVTGNWHNHKTWKQPARASESGGRGGPAPATSVVQCGAFIPTGWDNPGWDYGKVVVYDTTKPDEYKVFEVAGPRFLTLRDYADLRELLITLERKHAEALKGRGPLSGGYELFLRVVAGAGLPETRADVAAAVRTLIQPSHIHVELVSPAMVQDQSTNEEALRGEVKRLRSAEDIDELIDTHIKERVPEGLREDVAVLVRRALKGAK